MEKRFVGKVAFVTGATTGIGQATAVRLASEGALVGVRVGKPEEMASIIVFLLSDDASYLTCTTVLADPGFIVNAEL